MISATDLKTSITFLMEGKPFQVVSYTHKKIGRGGANIRVSIKNLKTGSLEEKTFSSTQKFDEINTLKRPLQFLYVDGDMAVFMDPTDFSQVEIMQDIVKDAIRFIKEGETASVMFWEDTPLSVEIAPKVTLEVKETVPGVKGNSATNVYKPATLENGLEVKVPLFIKAGDRIRVDTRTGDYIERVNK